MSLHAATWNSVSDERYKNVVAIYGNRLEDRKQIKPVKFTWKEDESYSCVVLMHNLRKV